MLAHWLATVGITIGILGGVGLGAVAWRLSQGPMDLAWFTGRLEAAAALDLIRTSRTAA